MKNTLFRISLAALAIVLLGSCEKINQRIDALEERIDGIETEKIASIDSQIASINSSIADLGTIRSNITSLRSQVDDHSTDIFNLEEADRALNDRILNLEDYLDDVLPTYAEKDWVKATFSTLAQYEATCDTIAKIDARIGKLDERLSKEIKACADSMKKWVNVQFEAYYTAAEMDAALSDMQDQIDSLKSGSSDYKLDSLANELTKTKAAVDTAKANIRKEYRAAIDTAIKTSEGKLTKALQDEIAKVNANITALTTRVTNLEISVATLTGRVIALEKMIQTVTIVPVYSDGSVEANGIILTVDFIVSPAKAEGNLKDKDIKVLINEVEDVATRAVSYKSLDARIDTVVSGTGMITIKADVSSVTPAEGKSLVAAVKVNDGKGSDCTSEFYPVYSGESNVKVEQKGNTTEVTISDKSANPKVSGGILSNNVFDKDSTSIKVVGIATVTFDETATKTIKDNASSTDVIFKVENVTTTKPVKDADVVLEVTMKTVGENGEEVFSGTNAHGEVTIEIPIGENVAYVNKVTLVDGDGNPIDGGVVPGSEKIVGGKLIFKVNHFSIYAIDYVTKADYKEVTGVSLNLTSVSLPVGDSIKLKATISPDNATNTKVTWSSSDPTKVTVDTTGTVKAIAFGTATITVTTDDGGKTATCTVKVTETKTISELLATNPDIPEVDDLTPPAKAWVNSADTACKAFVGIDEDGDKIFTAWKRIPGIVEDEIVNFGLLMTDEFVKTDENTYTYTDEISTVIVKMTEGKFTSCEFDMEIESHKCLNGTYAAPAPDFVEMKMGTGESAYTLKWMKYNLGATTVAGSYATCAGDYYAWGETEPYYGTLTWNGNDGTFDNWLEGKASGYACMSYCGQMPFQEWSTLPYDSSTKILKGEFDAAKQKLGDGWRMPTSQEFKDLADACGGDDNYNTSTKPGKDTQVGQGIYWCDNYDGVAGVLFCDGTNKLFFPAAGDGYDTSLVDVGSYGYYLSSTLSDQIDSACDLLFCEDWTDSQSSDLRYSGFSIRPVEAVTAKVPNPTETEPEETVL